MVTSTNNPQHQTFVHPNSIAYRTEDAMNLPHGSIFIPLTKLDLQNGEKKYKNLNYLNIVRINTVSIYLKISTVVDHMQKIRRILFRLSTIW